MRLDGTIRHGLDFSVGNAGSWTMSVAFGPVIVSGGGGVQSDWNETDASSIAYIKNKPTIPDAQIQADWSQTTTTAKNYIKNKPTIPAAQVQSDWNEASSSSKAYIQNKPTIPTKTSDLTNDFCPIIEDTRSQATDVNITGAAPFATLAGGQRIVLHFKYANTASPTLQLTLSGGTATTAYPLYQNYNNGVNALTLQAMPAGSYGEFVFDQTNSRWVLVGKDYNTTYSNTSQSDINSAAQGSRLIEPKLIHDNAYIVSLAYSSGSLKANKMYDFGEVTTALTIPDLDATNDLVSNVMNFWALHFVVGTLTPAGTTELSITFPENPTDNTKEIIVDDEPTIKEGDYVEIMITKHTVGNDTDYYASIKVWQAQSQNS